MEALKIEALLPKTVKIFPNPMRKSAVLLNRLTMGADGTVMDTTREDELTRAPGTRFTFMCQPSKRKAGNFNTGLDIKIINPYKNADSYRVVPPLFSSWESLLKDKDIITLQTFLEYKHGRNPGYYSDQNDVEAFKKVFKNEDLNKIPFFQTAAAGIDLNDGMTLLDMKNPIHEVLYFSMRASSLIANAFDQLTPESLYYISLDTSDIESSKMMKEKILDKATAFLVDIENKGKTLDFVYFLGLYRKGLESNSNHLYNTLKNYLRTNLDTAKYFESAYNMFDNPATRPMFSAGVLLGELVAYHIIRPRGSKYHWMPPKDKDGSLREEIVWHRKSDVLAFLSDADNKEEQVLIMEQLAYKKRF